MSDLEYLKSHACENWCCCESYELSTFRLLAKNTRLKARVENQAKALKRAEGWKTKAERLAEAIANLEYYDEDSVIKAKEALALWEEGK